MRIIRTIGLGKTGGQMARYRQIGTILLKYGFDDLLDRLHLSHYFRRGGRIFSRQKKKGALPYLTRYERIRMALEELGPTFIKLGQILSTRPDLISLGLVRELAKLQDQVPPVPFPEIREIVEKELGRPLAELFDDFQEKPLAAASIGQVHRARLKSGEEVVVKVRRPGICDVLAVDLAIMYHLASLMEKYLEEGEIYRPTLVVEEFALTIRRELDYTLEASQAERFARLFSENDSLYVPKIFRQTTCDSVLTMEYVEGIKVSDLAALTAAGQDMKLIAARGADLTLDQIFQAGFFHADPHPGNVLILPGNRICYLDFGMMGRVDGDSREKFAEMLEGYVFKDEKKIAEAVLALAEAVKEPDRRGLERDIGLIMEMYLYRPIKELRLGDLVSALLDLLGRHRLRLPPDLYLMAKALTEMEAIGLSLDPDFHLASRAAPFVKRLKTARLDPRRLWQDIFRGGDALVGAVKDIPADLRDIIKQIRQGRVKIVFEHRGLEKFIYEMDRSSNRISFALIISALVVASSLLITADIGPHLLGFPLLGLAGYLIAGLMGLWLLVSILRSGRL